LIWHGHSGGDGVVDAVLGAVDDRLGGDVRALSPLFEPRGLTDLHMVRLPAYRPAGQLAGPEKCDWAETDGSAEVERMEWPDWGVDSRHSIARESGSRAHWGASTSAIL